LSATRPQDKRPWHCPSSSSIKRDVNTVLDTTMPEGYECFPLRWNNSMEKVPFSRRITSDGTIPKNVAILHPTIRDHIGGSLEQRRRVRAAMDAQGGMKRRRYERREYHVAFLPSRRLCPTCPARDSLDSVLDQRMRHNETFFTFWDIYLNQHVNVEFQGMPFLEEDTKPNVCALQPDP
jgi:hypothetical protein